MHRRRAFTSLALAAVAGVLLSACACFPGGGGPDPSTTSTAAPGVAALSVSIVNSNGNAASQLALLCNRVNDDPNDSSAVCSATSFYSLRITNTGTGPTTSALTVTDTPTNEASVV